MPLHLFEAFGVELEYMVVNRQTLRVAPVVDRLLKGAATLRFATLPDDEDLDHPGSVEFEDIAWSNELALHVLELKTNGPSPTLEGLSTKFHRHITMANEVLAGMNAMLLPGGMHPTMNPDAEMKIWPHGYNEVYEAFNRIFDCKGHGWANLQSAHLNLPFADDAEFGRLHAAIRVLLPIMPALSAASPMMDGKFTGVLDNRLEVYRHNARRVPITSGGVVPEPVFTHDDYQRVILDSIYKAFEPLDPTGVLRHEWCNSRGAIARFSRNAIEIRVLDCQECPRADLAIVALVTAAIRGLVAGRFADLSTLEGWEVVPLQQLFVSVIRDAEQTVIVDAAFLRMFGVKEQNVTAAELWMHIRSVCHDFVAAEHRTTLDFILSRGTLARRISVLFRGADDMAKATASQISALAACLNENRLLGE